MFSSAPTLLIPEAPIVTDMTVSTTPFVQYPVSSESSGCTKTSTVWPSGYISAHQENKVGCYIKV